MIPEQESWEWLFIFLIRQRDAWKMFIKIRRVHPRKKTSLADAYDPIRDCFMHTIRSATLGKSLGSDRMHDSQLSETRFFTRTSIREKSIVTIQIKIYTFSHHAILVSHKQSLHGAWVIFHVFNIIIVHPPGMNPSDWKMNDNNDWIEDNVKKMFCILKLTNLLKRFPEFLPPPYINIQLIFFWTRPPLLSAVPASISFLRIEWHVCIYIYKRPLYTVSSVRGRRTNFVIRISISATSTTWALAHTAATISRLPCSLVYRFLLEQQTGQGSRCCIRLSYRLALATD